MNRHLLTEEVLVGGKDFWGRTTSVLLTPTEKSGWYWNVQGGPLLIDKNVLDVKRRRIMLRHHGERMHVSEHLLPLRMAGIDNVLVTPETDWLPYDGSAKIFWDACKNKLQHSGEFQSVSFDNTQVKDGRRFVRYSPTPENDLIIDVTIDYPKLGSYRKVTEMSKLKFHQLARVKTQGWPPYSKHIACLAAKFGWPHYNNVVWPKDSSDLSVLRQFSLHRTLDILGAVSALLSPGTMLTGTIHSHCAGHAHDVQLVHRLK